MQHPMFPCSIEAERCVLGALLIDPAALAEVVEFLKAGHFYRDAHRSIYEAMVRLYEHHQAADAITVCDELERTNTLDWVGGIASVNALVSEVPTSGNVEEYARIVERTAIFRQLIAAGSEIAGRAYRQEENALDYAEEAIYQIGQGSLVKPVVPHDEALTRYLSRLEDTLSQSRSGVVSGVLTGYKYLDRLLGGLRQAKMIVLASQPGQGKTSLALNIASYAVKCGYQVLFFSLEMDEEELMQRWVSMEAAIDSTKLRDARLGLEEEERVYQAISRLAALDGKLWLDDTCGLSVSAMRSKARRLQTQHGVDLIIMDYLQLGRASVEDQRKAENRRLEVEAVSRGLKGLARELNVPVLALAQLSRAVEQRADKVPQLSDLRETGCLTGETLIYLPALGVYRRIDQLVGQSGFMVLALNTTTWKLEPRAVTHAFSTGTKPVYKMTTHLGRTLRATANHQFLTIDGWHRLDELSVGRKIALPRTLTSDLEATMSPDELALLGHLIGDGCTLPDHATQYTTADSDLAELVADLATRVFGEQVRTRIEWQARAQGGWYQVFLGPSYRLTHGVRNPVVLWMETMGIYGLRSYQKYVPACVFRQPTASVAHFLRHLWATDGCYALVQEGTAMRARIYYCSSSPALGRDVQSLLLRLGINARRKRVSQGSKGRDQYHVVLSGKPELETFLEQVGACGERKTGVADAIRMHLSEHGTNTNRDLLPLELWRSLVLPVAKSKGITYKHLYAGIGMQCAGSSLFKRAMSRTSAFRVAQAIASEELAHLATSEVYWDEIVSIEADGAEEVYDLTVEGLHNFVANNIIVHNSIEMDADVVMFIHKDDKIPRDAPEYTVNIMIEKHRSGPVGIVPLHFVAAQTRYSSVLTREG